MGVTTINLDERSISDKNRHSLPMVLTLSTALSMTLFHPLCSISAYSHVSLSQTRQRRGWSIPYCVAITRHFNWMWSWWARQSERVMCDLKLGFGCRHWKWNGKPPNVAEPHLFQSIKYIISSSSQWQERNTDIIHCIPWQTQLELPVAELYPPHIIVEDSCKYCVEGPGGSGWRNRPSYLVSQHDVQQGTRKNLLDYALPT
jgi:hypothetical protein